MDVRVPLLLRLGGDRAASAQIAPRWLDWVLVRSSSRIGALARTHPVCLAGAAGTLLLAAALFPPWEFYSCCHGGFGFEPYAVDSAGHWWIGVAPPSTGGFPVRVAIAAYAGQLLGAAGLFACAAWRVVRSRAQLT